MGKHHCHTCWLLCIIWDIMQHICIFSCDDTSNNKVSGPWNRYATLQCGAKYPWTGIHCALFLAQDGIFDEIDIDGSGKMLL